ncbi:MAG: hypothetical protein GY928_28360 [Colwellia sp.]|nr:hypothetical protein [Colwellia sp.]
MVDLYHYMTVAMAILVLATYIKRKVVSAISVLVLANFLSYYATYYSGVYFYESALTESVRIAFVMVFCLYFGAKSLNPIPYLCYSSVLFGFIFLNALFLVNQALAPHSLYVVLTILEVVLFMQGLSAALQAKTKNDIPDYNNANNDNTTRGRFISNS